MDWRGEWWLRSPVLQQRSKQDTSPRGVCRCSPESQTPRSWHSPGESYIYPWMVANWTSFPIAFFNSIFRLMFYPDRKTHKLPPLEFHKADSRGSFCFNITRFQMPWNAIVILRYTSLQVPSSSQDKSHYIVNLMRKRESSRLLKAWGTLSSLERERM